MPERSRNFPHAMKTRSYKIKDASRRHSVKRMSRLLAGILGQPESYGSLFSFEGEVWGYAWLNARRTESVSMDFLKSKWSGITSALVTVRRVST